MEINRTNVEASYRYRVFGEILGAMMPTTTIQVGFLCTSMMSDPVNSKPDTANRRYHAPTTTMVATKPHKTRVKPYTPVKHYPKSQES